MIGEGTRLDRRAFIGAAGALAVAGAARAADFVDLEFSGGSGRRALTSGFPQKGEMILQRARPALLETPFPVFDQGVFTPNDRFFVRWHWSALPDSIDPGAHRLNVRGLVETPLSLSLADLAALPRYEIAAVNQCSGNSRGYFAPRVPGGEWGNGAMGNARWTGVRLKDVLDKAGVKAGAVAVRFGGLDGTVTPDAPRFLKSLSLDHARDGEVMIAWLMNGEPLPLLNGFPMRLVVPGWYATYWIKMLSDIEVLDAPDTNFWMKSAYLIPDTPGASVKPGETGFKTVPINRMNPRSFVTNYADGATAKAGAPLALRGIAFGGDCGVSSVEVSLDAGQSWRPAELGADEGAYSFRRWTLTASAPAAGAFEVWTRCVNTRGVGQPDAPNWNGGGFMRNVIERVKLAAA